ncbi:retrovirus-related pol polyprotein from transposon TNT 1-94 [Tanacetum coccineum]
MTTLAEHIIVVGAENRPPMLEKSMYDSWESRIHLFIKGKKHGRMMLDSIDNGPLVYPTVEENKQTRLMKYSELTEAQQLQDDCDVQATNIILHGLPDRYFSQSLINDMHTIGMIMQQVQVNTKFLNALLSEWSKFVTDVKLGSYHAWNDIRSLALVAHSQLLYNPSQSPQHLGEDPIECINKAMAFFSAVASRFPPSNNQLRTSSNPRNQATIQDAGQPRVVKCYNCQGEGHMARQCTQPKRQRNAAWFKEKLMLVEAHEACQILDEEQLAFLADPRISEALVAQQTIPQNLAFQTKDLDAYDSDYDDLSSAKAALLANPQACDP